mmetsp:Transcript_65489/g.206980  ORF Transcript_65489/g.206980 Transcript_65489/m.206980 type:complete len:144 (+) Transcript_65489:290-721(+)
MRDLAISRPDMELRELRRTVDLLKDESRDRIWRAEEDMLRKHRDFDSVYNSLERDNVKLRDEIRKTRRMVSCYGHGPAAAIDSKGAVWARCRRCCDMYDMNLNSAYACGYHPGELTLSGYTCCGVLPRAGVPHVYCHWRTHCA